MGPAELVFLVPITAIVLGVGGSIIQNILKSQERRLELRLQSQQGTNEEVTTQLKALRAEIAGLRDTSTQFDMSLEHTVQRLEERLGRIESKEQSSISPAPAAEETQRVSPR
jgi:predicted nuclease with TOPRIM domain